jgi:hypothetical protein
MAASRLDDCGALRRDVVSLRGGFSRASSVFLQTKWKRSTLVAPVVIREHIKVLGSDGVHVGTVDHPEGRDQVKLTKNDPDAGGEHHFIPLALTS